MITTHRFRPGLRLALPGLAALACAAGATPDIPWSSIDGGVGRMTGAGYSLTGTAGQHDAGSVSTSAGYALRGGFWQAVLLNGSPGCNDADLAPPFGVLDLADISAFIGAFTGGDLLADLTGEGVLDLSDINAFVVAFQSGCP